MPDSWSSPHRGPYPDLVGAADIRERLSSVFAGKRIIIAAEVAAPAVALVGQLRELGVEQIMVVAATEGVGPLPEEVDLYLTRTSGSSVMDGIRSFSHSLNRADPSLVDAVDAFDPDGTAWALAPPFGLDGPFIGRRTYGARHPAWIALEDKITVDALWDRAGVARAPSQVVEVASAAAAHHSLATDVGTVWVADNSQGWHGGGEYVRWVREEADVPPSVEWFGARAARVRVMPFLDGVPCSIHGYVTPAGEAVFRPVEMLIARRSRPSGFLYMGYATTWDPPGWIREDMRSAARRVARTLAQSVGYRGAFSIDGVATVDGFRPTELNPRLSPGFGIQAATVDGLMAGLLTRALIEGDVPVDPEWLEHTVVESADANRIARMGLPVIEQIEPTTLHVAVESGTLRCVDEPADGNLEVGSAISGSYVALRLDPGVIPPGASMAPFAVAGARLAAEQWGFDLPDIEPAPNVTG